jgi:GNAT superfamily N-acetyltransferase
MSRQAVFIQSFEISQLPEILAMADDGLGKNYLREDDFMGPESQVLVACLNNDPVGFLLCRITPSPADYIANLPEYLCLETATVILKSLVVKRTFRNKGIGKALIGYAVETFQNTHHLFLTEVWKGPGKPNTEDVIRSFNFLPVQQRPKHWYYDSLNRGYECPVCGNPCECSAVLFVKEV